MCVLVVTAPFALAVTVTNPSFEDDGAVTTVPTGDGPAESGRGDSTPPAAPTGLTATAGSGIVILDWADNTDNDLAGYRVYRSDSEIGPFSVIADNVPASYYEDNDVVTGMVYFYYVTAIDISNNESTNSEPTYASLRIPGDLDGNSSANLEDFALFTQNWLDINCWYCNGADLSGDERVTLEDLQILTENWLFNP